MNSVPAPPRARNVAKGPNSESCLLGRVSSTGVGRAPRARRRAPQGPGPRLGVAFRLSGGACPGRFRRVSASMGRPFGFAERRRVTLGSETCVRVAAARGRVLMRSWAADASSAVLGVRDASLSRELVFSGGACSHQPRSTRIERDTHRCSGSSCERSLQ